MTDLTAERTRKLAAEAQLAEMELAKARHEEDQLTGTL